MVSIAEPVLPDHGGACVTGIVPALVHGAPAGAWLPTEAVDADAVIVVVIDCLGWHQMQARRELVPVLSTLSGGPITTIAPSTTAAAMTSITTGTPPGEHGIVGYRIALRDGTLNALRWSLEGRDARRGVLPDELQPVEPFGGSKPPVVTRFEFAGSGFSLAHLGADGFVGYWSTSTLAVETAAAVRSGERFVFAYYDGLDKVAHTYGAGRHYDAELGLVDRLVGEVLDAAPAGTAVVVTADHGFVDCGATVVELDRDVRRATASQSGEARFRWLHARPGASDELYEATLDRHGDTGWVRPLERILDEGWFGPRVTAEAVSRLGDVALVAHAPIGYDDPDDASTHHLTGRHGSLTAEEMYVPLLVGVS